MRDIALIADSSEINRSTLHDILKDALPDGYIIRETDNGKKALEIMQSNSERIAIALIAAIMPEVDGMHVLKIYNDSGWYDSFPVIMITSRDGSEVESICYKLGVYDFARQPFGKELAIQRIQHAISLYQYQQDANNDMKRIKEICDKSDVLSFETEENTYGYNARIVNEKRGEWVTIQFNKDGTLVR